MTRLLESQTEGQTEAPTRRAVYIWRVLFLGASLVFIVLLAVRLWQTNVQEQRAAGEAPELSFTTFDGVVGRSGRTAREGRRHKFLGQLVHAPAAMRRSLLEQTWRREKENGIVFLGLDYLDQEPARGSPI